MLFLFAIPSNFISKCKIEEAGFAIESSCVDGFYNPRAILRSTACFDKKFLHFSG